MAISVVRLPLTAGAAPGYDGPMPNESEVSAAVEDLVEVRRVAAKARLETAMRRRNELKAVLDAGLVPAANDPRYAWLQGAVGSLFSVLEKLAEDFNAVNPDDCITVHDMHDALNSALQSLVRTARGAGQRMS